ncbi:hypothetical protein FDP41_013647 [Naegleria fowleri]|uniref:NmrA-like domain-containing protein n=1 Tax=Naegleria fowleri TaxID=5763 RepID=A0A6A5BQU7_NAEFO|nr:uncharacterized protein FDP41_013647 [Naegleria fowleri]KAF0980433.1 hypothetical protein FDP41_013647 [Naegleria fowleri]CAG4707793.1 unnamed protein product [Naegleria fowleri]
MEKTQFTSSTERKDLSGVKEKFDYDLKVLIVGASGHLGSCITKYLCENHQNEVKLSLLCPEESRNKISLWEKKLNGQIITFDVLNGNLDQLSQILKDFTMVLNCMNFFDPNEELTAEKNLINCCVKAGVRFYIPSDFSIDFRNITTDLTDLPRIQVRQQVHQLLNQSSLNWVSILCGVFIEKLLFEDCKLINREKNEMNYYGTGNEEFEVCTYEDVAKFVSELIARREFEKFKNQFLCIYTERITFRELGNWLRDIWGHDLKITNCGNLEDLNKRLKEVKGTDMTLYYYLQYMKVILMGQGRLTELDNQVWPTISKTNVKNVVRQWTSQAQGIAV